MNIKLALRKKAVRLYLQGVSKVEISRRVKRSRRWVYRWLQRYDQQKSDESLNDHSSAPKQTPSPYSQPLKEMVLRLRRERQAGKKPRYEYALISATAIYYELRTLGVIPLPSPRTIHSWLKSAGLIPEHHALRKDSNPTYPIIRCQAINDLHELDLKGPFYLKDSSQKYYLIVLRDVYGKRVAIGLLKNKEMSQIIDFLMTAWRQLGLPKFLQMDNGLEFRGSNLYPRAPSRLVLVCLDLSIKPVFIPTGEPWRNGVIENLNALIQRLFLKAKKFETEMRLRTETQKLENRINTTHRLPALAGKTPAEFATRVRLRALPTNYQWQSRDLRSAKGQVAFVRFVRKSGRITLTVKDKFLVGKKYKWQYVWAVVQVQQKRLSFYSMGKFIKSVAYR